MISEGSSGTEVMVHWNKLHLKKYDQINAALAFFKKQNKS